MRTMPRISCTNITNPAGRAVRQWCVLVGALSLASLAGCGPSKQDEVAGKSGCRLAEQFEQAAFEDKGAEPTFEQQRARDQFPQRVQGLAAGLEHAKTERVVEVMRKTCSDKLQVAKAAVEFHIAAGGEVYEGLGEFVAVVGAG